MIHKIIKQGDKLMRVMKRKLLGVVSIVIIGISLFSGCNTKDASSTNITKDVSINKEINVGLISVDESCCSTPVDKQQGFQTDLWDEIGKKSGYKVNFKSLKENEIADSIDSGKIDTIVYKFSTDDENGEKYNLTLPIIDNGIVSVNQYPFGKNPKNEVLLKEVNKTIKSMNEDGTIKKISDKWLKEN
jgi:ABC-type amino acid transport substrate-binding protein